ncbi:MAG TPA: adventurous gliding motility TPR repeat lipoprotein GltE [Anaeromyxobacter sp.]|nr:adventurous gliding motility TPR repeat lipoprotein GltE [Anaeromyxobacter sp.]
MNRRVLALATSLVLAACGGNAAGPARPATKPPPRPAATKPVNAPEPAPEPGAKAGARAAPAPATGLDLYSPRAQRLFQEAVQARADLDKQKLTDWPMLERRWREVLTAADIPEAHFNLGVALEAQGRTDEARAEYERARALKPALRQAAVNLGVLLEKSGDPRGAQAVYAGVVRDFPEDARARERLAALYLGAGQLDEAWRLAREALLRDPRSVTANKVLIRVAGQRNQVDLAQLIALRTTKLDPADPELPFLAGELAAKEGDDAAAEGSFRKALALDARFLPARAALLRAAVKRGRWGAALEHAEAYLRERPNDAAVQLAYGIALRNAGKADEALAAYGRAEELSGGRLSEVYLARGALHMQVKEECEPALQDFRKYADAAGPVAATESPVLKLQRECEAILEENRKAAEAAAQLKAQQKPTPATPAPSGEGAKDGAAAPTPPPIEVP